jgi:hypothetical protein
VSAAALSAATGCLVSRRLPEWDARTPADVALDSLPRPNGGQCGQAMTTIDTGEYPGFRLIALSTRDSTGGFLEMAVLAKAPASLRRARPPERQRPPYKPAEFLCGGGGGGSIGSRRVDLWVRVDTVWVDSAAIPMRHDNVLLLDVDETGEYRVAGRTHVRPRLNLPFPAPVDRDQRLAQMKADGEAIMPLLRTSPAVRRFMK